MYRDRNADRMHWKLRLERVHYVYDDRNQALMARN